MDPAAGEYLVFGDLEFDLGQRVLTRNGAVLPLKGRALDLLCVLSAANAEPASNAALMASVWPNTVVDENNLQVQISVLRRVLDQGDAGETFLVTVSGRGYRLIGKAGRRRDAKPHPAIPDKPSIA